MRNRKLIFLNLSLLVLGGCATPTPVVVNTELSDRLPKDAAISYLEKQRDLFGYDTYGQCVFKDGEVQIYFPRHKSEWEWANNYKYEDITLFISDDPIMGRKYELRGNDILLNIYGSRNTYSRGKQCSVMRNHDKRSRFYQDVTDPERASKIVSALQSLGVKYVAQ